MKKMISILVVLCVMVISFPIRTFALQYTHNHNIYEFDDTNYWVDGWCYKPLDETAKTAILVSYNPEIITGDNLVIPEEINRYKIVEFADLLFWNSKFKNCDLTKFPKLSQGMFRESSIEKVVLSPETKEIPGQCFIQSKINNINLPEGLEKIGASAFDGCSNLESIIIPASVTKFEDQAFACPNLKSVEFKKGKLTAINNGGGSAQFTTGVIFMTKNLETLIIPENIIDIAYGEFMETAVGRHGFSSEKYPDNLTVYGKKGTYAESYAKEHNLKFEEIKEETFESKYDISQFMDLSIYTIYDVFDTDYGAVVYYTMGGFMRAPGPGISLVRENGEILYLSANVSTETYWANPKHNDITLSDDGKYVTFNVSFNSRETAHTMGSGELFVLHDAGTYYYKSDLETGVTIETRFEPLDTLGEDVISTWAKPEVVRAIEHTLMPNAMRGNYKRNISRQEFARLSMSFLSYQYGYVSNSPIEFWQDPIYDESRADTISDCFIRAYCAAKPDRNGNPFLLYSDGRVFEGQNYNSIRFDEPFAKTEDFIYYNSVKLAYNFGVINGVSDTEFNPTGEITRQEAAAMLMRVYKNYAEYENADNDFTFVDDAEIADWAREDVYGINSLGVMQGVGDNRFAPLEHYTVEQAIATFLRLYESAPVSRKNKNIAPILPMETEKEKRFEGFSGYTSFRIKDEFVYDDYTIIYGVWSERREGSTDTIYVFYENGGVKQLTYGVDTYAELADIKINTDTNTIRFVAQTKDTFRLFNNVCGTEKVYASGKYKFEVDILTGNILLLERVL